jgi:hypothetical protein
MCRRELHGLATDPAPQRSIVAGDEERQHAVLPGHGDELDESRRSDDPSPLVESTGSEVW